jgi:hypothetical protein
LRNAGQYKKGLFASKKNNKDYAGARAYMLLQILVLKTGYTTGDMFIYLFFNVICCGQSRPFPG